MENRSLPLHAASSFMREVICYNQGAYVQYNFLAGESHKTLKDALRVSPKDAQKLRTLCGQLEEFLNTKLYRISLANFEFIKAYFRGRHAKEPRICIKGNYTKGGRNHIVQLVRDKKVNYPSEYPLEENSGFVSVKNSGKHFLRNDIPKSIVTDGYCNARIDTPLAQAYYEHKEAASATSNNHEYQYDESWIKCWKAPQDGRDSPSPIDPSSCYKSTLIIPMTLWNNKLAPQFLTKLRTEPKEIRSRTIFGYLCFDHVEENYFSDPDASDPPKDTDRVDIDVGYIFADLLSLYMITRAMYTELSATFSKAMLISLCTNNS